MPGTKNTLSGERIVEGMPNPPQAKKVALTLRSNSWYKKNKSEGRVYVWGGSLLHHLKTLRTPRYEHYHIVYRNEDDCWAFLGNGLTEQDVEGTVEGLTPFMRNADTPWEI